MSWSDEALHFCKKLLTRQQAVLIIGLLFLLLPSLNCLFAVQLLPQLWFNFGEQHLVDKLHKLQPAHPLELLLLQLAENS